MTELPRKAAARTARLAALPLGYAGRNAIGLGKRLGGKPAEAVMNEIQQRTAEQLFRTLGDLKGGAMKFGQALSVLEAALPEELAAPYREQLVKLQDSAPPMPTQVVRDVLARELGPDWKDQLVWLDGGPTAAASIGQVHKGRWHDGREVAVKVQYPGAGDALRSDLRQLARLARTIGPLVPGVDIKPLVAELQARATEELDYALEAEAQRTFAAAFRDDPEIVVPDVVAVGETVLVTEWLESPASLASVITEGSQAERDHFADLFVRFLFAGPARTGMLHADPHPGNFRVVPDPDGGPARMGVLDFGAVARLPEGALPVAMGSLIRIAGIEDDEALLEGLRSEGFVKDRVRIDPAQLLDYLSPFVEPTQVERFRFSRAWMQQQFQRINDPRSPTYTIAMKLNLPPSYLLIHRTWLGGIGVLSQLEAEAPFRQILTESLPGFAEPGPDPS
ncbi:putative unusual protein kinase regulating ubiquinone biosynthesis (AarF/ABC1/UbiB family) [Nocardioides ginsengisegetis]|uniref:Putative unusual protein kinase regulating ubiquinone biosynthesis (AarF/ABC1/UbiB family) n=1 Tax=Nocardioides ginsengisegetis TaxID=661491 RepID=A0A7W3J1J0_9ACTN|nr:AarF/ABC1/UbiB kinase family protein [Nocardioides ginsengisegetis]MBA8804588.1 putative unusual protein kinase regulating ubiquinone biosynthesis (AarF/ABC1/UbiB family) [Nocardioides ginsengisegetis]